MTMLSKLTACRTPIAEVVEPVTLRIRVALLFLVLTLVSATLCSAQQTSLPALKQLSLEQLMDVEVTSVAKKEQKVGETAAAIFVITQEDIRRSGVTSIPEALRLAPGVEVNRVDANKWSIGVRGFGSRLSR